MKKPGRPETFGWGCCKMAGRPPYRFLSTTPSENTVGQTMIWLSIFRSRNRVLERPFWRHLMICPQVPPTRLDDAWQPSEKGLFEDAWKAPHPRKELLEEAWKAQNPRKGLLEQAWKGPSRCLSTTPSVKTHPRIGSSPATRAVLPWGVVEQMSCCP